MVIFLEGNSGKLLLEGGENVLCREMFNIMINFVNLLFGEVLF